MYNLALYYEGEGNDSIASDSWWRKSVQQGGDKRAISRVLSDCGPEKAFAKQEAEKALLKSLDLGKYDMRMEAMYFYLGGYCGHVDLSRVRNYYSPNARDYLTMCDVALKYGEIVKSVSNDAVDRKNAIGLLQECTVKSNSSGDTHRRAEEMLASLQPYQ